MLFKQHEKLPHREVESFDKVKLTQTVNSLPLNLDLPAMKWGHSLFSLHVSRLLMNSTPPRVAKSKT